MASNGLQPGFEDAPAFPEEDALAAGADLEEIARYAMRRGNFFKGITSARNAWVSDGYAREGHAWYDTTTDALYLYSGAGWVLLSHLPATSTLTLDALYTGKAGAVAPAAWKSGGRGGLQGTVDVVGTTNWVGGTTYPLGTIAAGFRPPAEVHGIARFGTLYAILSISTAGAITFAVSANATAAAGTLTFGLDLDWPL